MGIMENGNMEKTMKSGTKTVEVSRSFSRKVQIAQYEPIEFFSARKVECAIEEAGEWGKRLVAECVAEVERDIEQYRIVTAKQKEAAQLELDGLPPGINDF